jgi:ABC-2 type transport system permease protein
MLVRYRGSLLGWIWSYFKPAMQFLVYWLAVGVFLRANSSMEAFAIYLFSGQVIINLFSEAFSNGTGSITGNADLIKKIYMPREIFPVAATLIAIINFLPQLVILIVVCSFLGWHPSLIGILAILAAIVITAVLATGLGMLFGAINVAYRDSQNFVDLILLIAAWGSPVLYTPGVLAAYPSWLTVVYFLNPLTPVVELMHEGLWGSVIHSDPRAIDNHVGFTVYTGIAAAVAIVVLLIGQLVFRRLEGRFAQDL